MSTQLPQSYEGAPDPGPQYSVIPAGVYRADITNFTNKRTKAGDGSYAEIELTLAEGERAGSKVWARHTTQNPNQTAVAIGARQIKDLANAALGEGQILSDLAQLTAKSVTVELTVSEGRGNYGPSNEVKRYYPANAQAGGAPALPAGGAASNDAPW